MSQPIAPGTLVDVTADGDLVHTGTVVIDDADGIIMSRTALTVRGTRRTHAPTTIEIKRPYVLDIRPAE